MRGRRNAAKATIEHKGIINPPIEQIIICTRLNILLAGFDDKHWYRIEETNKSNLG